MWQRELTIVDTKVICEIHSLTHLEHKWIPIFTEFIMTNTYQYMLAVESAIPISDALLTLLLTNTVIYNLWCDDKIAVLKECETKQCCVRIWEYGIHILWNLLWNILSANLGTKQVKMNALDRIYMCPWEWYIHFSVHIIISNRD